MKRNRSKYKTFLDFAYESDTQFYSSFSIKNSSIQEKEIELYMSHSEEYFVVYKFSRESTKLIIQNINSFEKSEKFYIIPKEFMYKFELISILDPDSNNPLDRYFRIVIKVREHETKEVSIEAELYSK